MQVCPFTISRAWRLFLDLVLGLAKLFGLTKYQIQTKHRPALLGDAAMRWVMVMVMVMMMMMLLLVAAYSFINLQLLQPAHQFAVTMLRHKLPHALGQDGKKTTCVCYSTAIPRLWEITFLITIANMPLHSPCDFLSLLSWICVRNPHHQKYKTPPCRFPISPGFPLGIRQTIDSGLLLSQKSEIS